jgi:tetratricopeptide (TPR) repeat protein
MRCQWFIVACCALFAFPLKGQNKVADSLRVMLEKNPARDSVRVMILTNLAYEEYFDHPLKAAEYSLEAKDISTDLKYPRGIALSYRYIGVSFWAQANMSRALEYLLKGLSIADSLQDQQIQADITGNIGLVHNGLGNYRIAIRYFSKSLELQRKLKNSLRESVMLNNMGDSYLFLKKYDSALLCYSRSLLLGKPTNFGVTTNLRNIGNVWEELGQLDTALRYYETAKTMSDQTMDRRGMTQTRKSIASVYLKNRRFNDAKKYAHECLAIASEENIRAIMRDSYQLLSRIEEAQGNFNESLKFHKLYTAYRDSVQNISELSEVAALQMDYEVQQKQNEIDLLKKENQLKNTKLRLNTTLLIASIIILLLLGGLLFTIIRDIRKLKALNKLLVEKNHLINHQREEIVSQNKDISSKNDELLTLNEELQSQQEQVVMQRDELAVKNLEIQRAHMLVTELNLNLEKKVAERTQALERQNAKLNEYNFINAHKLRAPLASILGLVNLLREPQQSEDQKLLLSHLHTSAKRLDQVIHEINSTIEAGLNAYKRDEAIKEQDT